MCVLCSSARSPNAFDVQEVQCAIGAAIMPFYLHGGFNKGDTWSGAPNKFMLAAVQAGKARIHREIGVNDVSLEKEIFQSPLCKVFRGTWEGHTVAVKKFSQYSLGFSWEDFYKEVGLLSIAQHPHVVKLVCRFVCLFVCSRFLFMSRAFAVWRLRQQRSHRGAVHCARVFRSLSRFVADVDQEC